jgi:succinoglycan biosynthesis protein ExoA
MTTTVPLVTVIIPVLNEADFINKSLSVVITQDYPTDRMEILVVDGGSTDGTPQIVQEIARTTPHVKLLHNPKRIQAAAMNLGIQAAQGDIVIRVDGHTIIALDYVRKCVEYLCQGKADSIGGMMRPVGTTYVGQGVALVTSSPFGIGGSKFHYSDHEQYVDTVYMGAYWREIFNKIGLYDETFRINEDYELNYRLRKAGGKILLSPAVKSTYTPRSSLTALWWQYFRYGRWKIRTLQKHPTSLKWRQIVSPLFVSSLLGSLLLALWWPYAWWCFALIAGFYLLANLVASTIAAKRGGWRYLPVLPLVFAFIHIAWGLGFWYGIMLIPFTAKR